MGTGSHHQECRRRAAPAPRCRRRRAPRALTGAVEENRTPVASLARSHSTVELPPQVHRKKRRAAGRRAPAHRVRPPDGGPPRQRDERTGKKCRGKAKGKMVTHELRPVRWSDEGSNLDPCRAKAVFSRLNYHPEPAVLASDLHHRISISFSPHILYPLIRWAIIHRSHWVHRSLFCGGARRNRTFSQEFWRLRRLHDATPQGAPEEDRTPLT